MNKKAKYHYVEDVYNEEIEREYFEDAREVVAGDVVKLTVANTYQTVQAIHIGEDIGPHVVLSPTGRIRIDGFIYEKAGGQSDHSEQSAQHASSLAQEVVEIKRKLDEIEREQAIQQRNIRTIGEEGAHTDYKAGQALVETADLSDEVEYLTRELRDVSSVADKALVNSSTFGARAGILRDEIEMLTDDIVYLDERTQALATDEGASEFASEVSAIIRCEIERRLEALK